MGPGSFPNPEQDDTRAQTSFDPPFPRPEEPVGFWRREPKRRYIILFVLTFICATFAGIQAPLLLVLLEPRVMVALFKEPWLLLHGLWYSVAALAILGAHEFGHYIACVRYRVNASLPYFLPMPLAFGTLGAVIRIRQPIPGKRALFDIGIAGPLAGFALILPILFAGMLMSSVGPIPAAGEEFGDPLLLKLTAWMVFGPIPEGHTVFMHPLGMAAWFGMLATALNLFPIGQLDGGHITYAIFGQKVATATTLVSVVALVALTVFVSKSWILWTVLTVAMIGMFGPRHPPVFDEDVPLNPGRFWLAALALVVFILSFTPSPLPLDSLF